jgi:hypothetical protein
VDEPTGCPRMHGRKEESAITRPRRRHATKPSRPRGRQHRITVTGNPKPDPDLNLIAQALVIIGRHLNADRGC